ncbi:MAG: hypothetical protein NTW16_00715 [Bacteroidetes bacterium]|nr:hypothetical protein [Bacteroidota bacterium]
MKKIFYFSIIALIAIFAIPTHGATVLASVPMIGSGLSLRQLEDFANGSLSSFDGDEYEGDGYADEYEGDFDGYADEYEGDFDGYTGAGDDFVDFGGYNKTFANAAESGRLFIVTLTNANAASRTALLCPGYLYYPGSTMNGAILDGAFNDTTGAAGLTGSGSPKSVTEFFAFVSNAPVAISGIKIESTLASQVAQQLIIEHMSPFKQLEQQIINLGSYQNENTFRDKIVTIPTPNLVLSNNTKIYLPIVGSSTCTITFLAGAILNPAHALQQKLGRAGATMQRVGVARVKAAGNRKRLRK